MNKDVLTKFPKGVLKLPLAVQIWLGVNAGEVLHLPANVQHKAEALEDTLDVDVFSPPRQDWLDGTDTYFHQKEDQ